ncbi:transcriptional regulator, AraC family protein [Roseobacter sp. SK209-2-6]|uniref:helix-turn-helix transcriptional regulator n=1 Tax=Roseobacter sp. SK209-2-6 TaxID=388739 RepID=UPI0000F3C157|nr:AraC family transcriptional regulator [Roseobacter sp. SK209-2-6]EBA15396.1 transcriptional regulator, AraC family protein [Roseobacter sp. SK209-2-6]
MSQSALLDLPLPLFTAALCFAVSVLLWHREIGHALASRVFAGLFFLFAVESLLVSLRFGYGYSELIVLQRLLPLFAGPLTYIGFALFAVSDRRASRLIGWHISIATTLAILISVGSQILGSELSGLVDLLIALSYTAYLLLILRLHHQGADALIQARFDTARLLRRWMLWAIFLLAGLLLLDSAIALSFALQDLHYAMGLMSVGSVILAALLILMLVKLPQSTRANRVSLSDQQTDTGEQGEAASLEQATRKLLLESQLYLDPELTVQRLARRLHVPERSLSTAINQSQGMNISQYVNGFRLEHAANLLRGSTLNIGEIARQSGFLTRSNFYREFKRAYDQTPSDCRAKAQERGSSRPTKNR